MKIWVTRDKLDTMEPCGVFLHNNKEPLPSKQGVYPVADMMLTLKKFVKWFGFTPDKGTCEQYELTLTEIEE